MPIRHQRYWIPFLAMFGCAEPAMSGADDSTSDPTHGTETDGSTTTSSSGATTETTPAATDAELETGSGDTRSGDTGSEDVGTEETDGGAGACVAGFRAMIGHDLEGFALGEDYAWSRAVADDTYSVSHNRAVRVSLNPGEALLPECSGSHFFAGRRDLPAPVPPGKTVWLRVYQYIPSTFSFGYKYAGGDAAEADVCDQSSDGNSSVKWLVLAPDIGTARVYLMPSAARRALANSSPRIRVISEALHQPGDFMVDLPRDRWFALQLAVRVSDGDDGFIRAWLDDEYLGEVVGRTASSGASLVEWGMGDYWNGIPWTDGAPGRSDFWVDEMIVASDADGYDVPTGVDAGGRAYIAPCTRVSELIQ